MSKPDAKRLIEFHDLLNRFAEIERIIHVKRHKRYELESDTEHSYNLAMMAWFLGDYFPKLKNEKVVMLALVHDLVEIYAGDTFAFADKEILDSKSAREAKAMKRLSKEWSDFPGLNEAIHEYETRKSEEARFVYALDKIMPVITIILNEGFTWKEKQISLEMLDNDKLSKIEASSEVIPYWHELRKILLEKPELFGAKD